MKDKVIIYNCFFFILYIEICGDNMEKVKIRCISYDSICLYRYKVKIYNSRKELIYEKEVINDNFLYVDLEIDELYKIKVIPFYSFNYKIMCKSFIVKKGCCDILFLFNSYNRYFKSKFTLTDSNYKNLEIQKGEIYLWLDPIQ